MSSKQKALLQLANHQRAYDQLIAQLDRVDPSYHNIKVTDSQWSNVQILNHLYIIEEFAYNYLSYKVEEGMAFSKQSFWTNAKFALYLFILKLPLKFKAPTAVAQPSNEEDIDEVKAKFATLRSQLSSLVSAQDEDFFKKAPFKHVLIGRISIQRMYKFFTAHQEHHRKQFFKNLVRIVS